MISTRHQQETIHFIHGPVGQLEMSIGKPLSEERKAWGIICHPHSLHGGTMENKVVTTLAKTFQYLGLSTVRFNFRGVGQSEGKYDKGHGELDDLMKVIEWVLNEKPDHEIWLAGFSFGAYVVTKAATKIPVARLVTVAPPVFNFDMQKLPPILAPWVLVQGDNDEIVPAAEVIAWAESRQPPPTILRFPKAGHFFHGQLVELRMRLEEVLRAKA